MKFILLFLYLNLSILLAQQISITKIEPPNWWNNHSYNKIQLMVYGKNFEDVKVESNDKNFIVEKVFIPQNTNYCFVDVFISNRAEAKNYELTFSNKNGITKYNYSLLERNNEENEHQGFSSEDVVYLIFPDRFSNGDTANDFLFNEKEEFEFKSLNGRHGGDIQGMIDQLDYIKQLGATAIWSTPLLENNMYMSYHGYAATDLYNVDPRFGTNELYKKFVSTAHKKGLKIIYDHVANHIGINHSWIENPPTNNWFHGTPQNHQNADHNKLSLVDNYADKKNITSVDEGWFTNKMPDLNQSDCHVSKYIIQNTIWWIEFSGIDGIREDTYPYVNQQFMSKWAKTILDIYPNFNIVGEVWKGEPAVLAKFQTNTLFEREFDSHLPVVTDFAIRDAIVDFMSGKANLNKIYEIFGKDFVYSNPNNLLIFFDNHDTDRGMFAAKNDLFKFKAGITLVLTTRGIPQIFYGTEIGLDGGGHHGRIRGEFPGGFPGDSLNAFNQSDRNITQNDIFDFTIKLLHLRKEFDAIRNGKFTHFAPKDDLYIYKKTIKDQEIIFAINDNMNDQIVDLSYYIGNIKNIKNNTIVKNLMTGDILSNKNLNTFTIPNKSISIYLID
ncbi:MAG: cyclomaltodextrinase N-terminal domain-containing protein [Ignavibacteriales bacterium]|nr:cyclomaltodextrinase N-terminal domain-containing protein [Ignavibacteriales bacterium]MCB9218963.1 cyclomaltodextrinase N-terminal domain-containing protein [Ignavibacteriales bacterium]